MVLYTLKRKMLGLLLGLFAGAMLSVAGESPCDRTQHVLDTDACLGAMREALVNTSYFWFGREYPTRCPVESRDSLDCYTALPDPGYGFSLAQNLFDGTLDPSRIDRFVFAVYNSPVAAKYEACGHIYQAGSDYVHSYFIVDPLSDIYVESFKLRNLSAINWVVREGVQYTLLFVDGETRRLHGLWTNIPGDEIQDGQEEVAYREPINFRSVGNPFVFILYQQTKNVTLDDEWRTTVNNPYSAFDLPRFARQYGLEGPFGMTWVLVGADSYSIGNAAATGVANNCASLVTADLRNLQLSYAGRYGSRYGNRVTLPVYMTVTIETDLFNYTHCCEVRSVGPGGLTLDPLGDAAVDPAAVRTGVNITAHVERTKVAPNFAIDFKGQYFTLIFVDINNQFEVQYGDRRRPVLHWLVTNMEVDPSSGDLAGGQTVVPYEGPLPANTNDRARTFMFMLFTQSTPLHLADVSPYSQPCVDDVPGRCFFEVAQMAEEQDLEVASASWMVVDTGGYVYYTRFGYCVEHPGPCPETDACAIYRQPSHWLTLFLVILWLTK